MKWRIVVGLILILTGLMVYSAGAKGQEITPPQPDGMAESEGESEKGEVERAKEKVESGKLVAPSANEEGESGEVENGEEWEEGSGDIEEIDAREIASGPIYRVGGCTDGSGGYGGSRGGWIS